MMMSSLWHVDVRMWGLNLSTSWAYSMPKRLEVGCKGFPDCFLVFDCFVGVNVFQLLVKLFTGQNKLQLFISHVCMCDVTAQISTADRCLLHKHVASWWPHCAETKVCAAGSELIIEPHCLHTWTHNPRRPKKVRGKPLSQVQQR